MTSSVTNNGTAGVPHAVTDGSSHTSPSRARGIPVPSRPVPVPTHPYPARSHFGLSGTTGDYDAYLDSMLAHLRRVHREASIAYYSRRLTEMGIGA